MDFASISNSLTLLLRSSDETVRWKGVALLSRYPGEFSEQALRKAAEDTSPKVRAAVAIVIGNGTVTNLLPVLVKLFGDPVGRQKPVSLSIEQLEAGATTGDEVTVVNDPNFLAANVGDVHTSAGYALLNFDLSQIGDFFKTNLSDKGFRLQFLLKLAEADPKPWVSD